MLIVIPSGKVRFLKTVLQDSFDGVSDMMIRKAFFKNKKTLTNVLCIHFPKNYVSM